MTRTSIERSIYIFIVAPICTFIYTVCKVLGMIGWL